MYHIVNIMLDCIDALLVYVVVIVENKFGCVEQNIEHNR